LKKAATSRLALRGHGERRGDIRIAGDAYLFADEPARFRCQGDLLGVEFWGGVISTMSSTSSL